MFKPATDKAEDAIWVPIAKAKWFWKAPANKQGENWVVSQGKMKPSIDLATVEFPMYETSASKTNGSKFHLNQGPATFSRVDRKIGKALLVLAVGSLRKTPS